MREILEFVRFRGDQRSRSCRQGGPPWTVFSRDLKRWMQRQRLVLGSVCPFGSKGGKVCMSLGDGRLGQKGECFKFKELFVERRKEEVQEQLGIGSVSGMRI